MVSLTPSIRKEKDDVDKKHSTTPSPKPKYEKTQRTSVRSRKEKFEEKNYNHQNVKQIMKEHSKNKRNFKTPAKSPEKEDPLMILMKEIRNELREVKSEVSKNHIKMDSIHNKVNMIEKNQSKYEEESRIERKTMKKEISKARE